MEPKSQGSDPSSRFEPPLTGRSGLPFKLSQEPAFSLGSEAHVTLHLEMTRTCTSTRFLQGDLPCPGGAPTPPGGSQLGANGANLNDFPFESIPSFSR